MLYELFVLYLHFVIKIGLYLFQKVSDLQQKIKDEMALRSSLEMQLNKMKYAVQVPRMYIQSFYCNAETQYHAIMLIERSFC